MITEFYYGSSCHWPLKHIPRVMLSYNLIRKLKRPWKIEIPFMLDSGAYSVILLNGAYPYGPKAYAASIKEWKPDIAWTMDFPCEPSVREMGNYTPLTAQMRTNSNTIVLNDQLQANVMNVVQGWKVSDYLANIDLIKERGLLTQHLGIGSICRRGQTDEIVRIIKGIHNNVPGWVKLHGFGVKLSILQTEARFFLYSADSSSWSLGERYYRWRSGAFQGQTYHSKVPHLQKYVAAIEDLITKPNPLYALEVIT